MMLITHAAKCLTTITDNFFVLASKSKRSSPSTHLLIMYTLHLSEYTLYCLAIRLWYNLLAKSPKLTTSCSSFYLMVLLLSNILRANQILLSVLILSVQPISLLPLFYTTQNSFGLSVFTYSCIFEIDQICFHMFWFRSMRLLKLRWNVFYKSSILINATSPLPPVFRRSLV